MIGLELEVLAKKFDRFAWDRDRDSPAHDRIITDWMDALHDYPLEEVQAACKAAVRADPKRMPNEGAILAHIDNARRLRVQKLGTLPAYQPERERASPEAAAAILAEAGFTPKRMDKRHAG